ncbi:NAD(P)/FAD-dependent oxidoreductase [Catenuloplanes japonicus]|uniref:NAD(P)/FAD-dependent oxidoreductase n=1 Tax=Catenuloplanes japonicus TaxID=33876 RepID=UPI0005252937|nr:NAD(P)/FAD-dependent oxidoreductase [Catenuloplanes japonicus]
MNTDLDVAVVGAGLAGLAAADVLRRSGRTVQVFETRAHVGGRMATRRVDGYLLDEGAEMISSKGYPATWRLIRRHGLDPATEVPSIRAGVAAWHDGRIRAGLGDPFHPAAGGLSPRGRIALLRLLADLSRSRAEFPFGDVTVAGLADVYGSELVDRLLQPLATGMCGWLPERASAGPFLANVAAVGPPSAWRTYTDGMDTLARRIAATVDVRRDTRVRQVTALSSGHARLELDGETLTARTVLLAVPAPIALTLHPGMPDDARAYAEACRYSSVLRLSCLLDTPLTARSRRPPHMVAVAETESATIAGLTFDHVRHPGRAPAGRGLVSVLAAPRLVPELLAAPDAEVTALLLAAAEQVLPGLTAAVRHTVVTGFRHGLPEPGPDALALRAAFLARPPGPIDYAGDWVALRPSSEGAARSGELAAERILADARRTNQEVAVP